MAGQRALDSFRHMSSQPQYEAEQGRLGQAQCGRCQSRDVHQISWIAFQLCSNLWGEQALVTWQPVILRPARDW
jgi:hypothetical protein